MTPKSLHFIGVTGQLIIRMAFRPLTTSTFLMILARRSCNTLTRVITRPSSHMVRLVRVSPTLLRAFHQKRDCCSFAVKTSLKCVEYWTLVTGSLQLCKCLTWRSTMRSYETCWILPTKLWRSCRVAPQYSYRGLVRNSASLTRKSKNFSMMEKKSE
jgi:hypothetical protein